jgi:hypothetical protein
MSYNPQLGMRLIHLPLKASNTSDRYGAAPKVPLSLLQPQLEMTVSLLHRQFTSIMFHRNGFRHFSQRPQTSMVILRGHHRRGVTMHVGPKPTGWRRLPRLATHVLL